MKRNLTIVRLGEADALRGTDHLGALRDLILGSEAMYPAIQSWWSSRVVPGLASGERIAFVGYDGGRPAVSAVVKRGEAAKFCHLKLGDDIRDRHLGEIFFALMALEVRGVASSIHFTLPEGLWAERQGFFRSFGFREVHTALAQYRTAESELRCETPFGSVWSSVLEKLPKLVSSFSVDDGPIDNQLLLSIQPRWAEGVLTGRKTVEVRRRFSDRWIGRRLSLYASRPIAGLVGEATIADVVPGSPKGLWEQFGAGIGCSKAEFETYTGNLPKVNAILLTDVTRYPVVISLTRIREMVGNSLRPPQSHLALSAATPWGRAVSIASLLGSRFGSPLAL